MFNDLSNRCFGDCINDFTTKSVKEKEEQCVIKCVNKFLRYSERIGQRFNEQNALLMHEQAVDATNAEKIDKKVEEFKAQQGTTI